MALSIREEYFEWMYNLVCNDVYSKKLSYRKLLRLLHEREFSYTIFRDRNRDQDGKDLRFRFGIENGYSRTEIEHELNSFDDYDRPCSVLEMMIALSIRCEESIMNDDAIGDRVGQWFWNMIVSLGLGHMSDQQFDSLHCHNVINTFLRREYEPDGKGGLFTIEDCPEDLTKVEIWYQMCWYLNYI